MGHVDHGKTTLLDTLRSAAVAKGEAGGITQHIGAFSVPVDGEGETPRTITFLDTPGHAAFSAMRARGASVTDIVVLVVSADDGIMPQTREVLRLIEQDKLNAVVAINKVDKPGVDVVSIHVLCVLFKFDHGFRKMFRQLSLLKVSSWKPLEAMYHLSLSRVSPDKAFPSSWRLSRLSLKCRTFVPRTKVKYRAIYLNPKCAKDWGMPSQSPLHMEANRTFRIVATVLILRGCLKPGAQIICGTSHGKVRVMLDSQGRTVKAAHPGMAVTVTGWKTLPNAGDEVLQGTESDVKKAVANRIRKAELESTLGDVEAINEQRKAVRERKEEEQTSDETSQSGRHEEADGPKELRLVVKGDVSGSVEAVVEALQVIGNKEACVKIVASGVGDMTESDVLRAQAAKGEYHTTCLSSCAYWVLATLVAFSVSTPRSIETIANQNNVSIVSSNVIYTLIDQVRARVIGLLPPIFETKVTGEAMVLQLFDIQLKAKQTRKVAGCRVVNGTVDKSKIMRVVRDRVTVFEGLKGHAEYQLLLIFCV
jgi:translation initiation factor IF-2